MSAKSVIAVAMILLAATVSLFYFAEKVSIESESRNDTILADFRELNYIHGAIEKDLFKLQANKIRNFDQISRLQSLQGDAFESLQNEASLLLESDYIPIAESLALYQKSYQITIPLVDTYKRNIAFTRNSLNYSMHLVRQMLESLPDQGNSQLKEKLNYLLTSVLQYLVNDSVNDQQNTTQLIQELRDYFVNIEQPISATFETLAKHLSMVLKGNQVANASLTEILASPHNQQLEVAYNRYLEKQQSALQKHQLYTDLSIFGTVLLVIFILQAIYKLVVNTGKLSQQKAELEESITQSRESLLKTNQRLEREILQRTRAEEASRDAAMLYQHCNEGVLICDKDKKVISMNPAFSKITGISRKQLIGAIPTIFDPTKIPEEIVTTLVASLESKGEWHGEVETLNADKQKSSKEVAVIALKSHGEIHRYLVILVDITERKQNEATIYNQANYDPLTQLPNRNLFNERAEQTLARAQRSHNKFAVLFVDLDNFKKINDNLGHTVGDELLIELASRLRESSRRTDTVSRFGGDEFIIIVDNLKDRRNINVIIDKFVSSISTPVATSAETLHISGSIGVSMYPEDGADIPTLIRCADMAMYRAKAQGKNTYRFFEEQMDAEVHEYHTVETLLRSAITNGELFLEYQPIIEASSKTIYAVEALARWNNGLKGLIPPAKFIHIAEESGLIISIGEWIMRTACAQLALWNRDVNAELKVSINISTLQFKDKNFNEKLLNIINETGINPRNLNFEITESLFLEDRDSHIFTTLQDLRARGISISLDDFGTGYASLNYLKRFPINVLKIDRSFITDIIEDKSDQSLVIAIINMAKALGIKVVAEGVETEPQYRLLTDYLCDYIQGYYFSRPISDKDFQHLHKQSQEVKSM